MKIPRAIRGIGLTMVIAQAFGLVKAELAVQFAQMGLSAWDLRWLIYGSSAAITVLVASVNYLVARRA